MRALRPLLAPRVLVLLVLVAASCGGDDGTAAAEVSVAFLRAVHTDVTEPQEAFIEELAAAGYVEGDNLTLVASDPTEVHDWLATPMRPGGGYGATICAHSDDG